ncbi:MAG: aromatic amino acid lyase, partial [Candidatus Promineifilaceae bacterium]
MEPILINGQSLLVDDVVAVARGRRVALDPDCIPRMRRSREAVEQIVREGRVAYGITTGFGRFKDKIISADEVRELQLNLVRSHAAGVGPDLEEQEVRAMLLIRA